MLGDNLWHHVALAYAPVDTLGTNWGVQLFVDGVPETGYSTPVSAPPPPNKITFDSLFASSMTSPAIGAYYKGQVDELRIEPLTLLDANFVTMMKKDLGSWQPPRTSMIYLEFSHWYISPFYNDIIGGPITDSHNPALSFRPNTTGYGLTLGVSRKNDNTIDMPNEGYGLRLFTGSKCFARTKDSLIGLTGKLGDVKVGSLLTVSASDFTKLNLSVGDKIVLANADRQSQNVVSALASPSITLNFSLDFDYLISQNSLILGKRISEGCAAIPTSLNFGAENFIAETMRLYK